MTDLETLATRLEQAGPDSQRTLLCEAFRVFFPEVSSGAWDAIDAWDAHYDRFTAMLDCGAYLSAAELLVPVGWVFSVDTLDEHPEAVIGNEKRAIIQADYVKAKTPALALAAACVRATIAGKEI